MLELASVCKPVRISKCARHASLQGGEEVRGPLTPGELDRLRADVRAYVAAGAPDATLETGPSMLTIRAAFGILKDLVRGGGGGGGVGGDGVTTGAIDASAGVGGASAGGVSTGGDGGDRGDDAVPNKGVYALQEEAKRLRLQVQQRDNEINILVAMLKKRGGALAAPGTVAAVPPASSAILASPTHSSAAAGCSGDTQPPSADVPAHQGEGVPAERQDVAAAQRELLDVRVLKDRSAAFELFRKSYRRNAAIEDNKAV